MIDSMREGRPEPHTYKLHARPAHAHTHTHTHTHKERDRERERVRERERQRERETHKTHVPARYSRAHYTRLPILSAPSYRRASPSYRRAKVEQLQIGQSGQLQGGPPDCLGNRFHPFKLRPGGMLLIAKVLGLAVQSIKGCPQ
jgi:hypothetical protein